MNWLHTRTFKIISIIVLFFFSWTFGGLFDIAYAVKDVTESSASADQPKAEKPEEKFQKTIQDIEQILTDTVTDTKKSKLKAERLKIEALDVEIRKQFAETEQKLKDAKLPEEILKRHYDFVKKYEDNLNELKANLDAIEKHSAKSIEFEEAIKKTKAHLEKVRPPKKHIPLDPNKLPHRTPEPTKKKPRTKPEEFGIGHSAKGIAQRGKSIAHSAKGIAQRQKPILVASNGPLTGILTRNPQPVTRNFSFQSSQLPTQNPSPNTYNLQPILLAQATNLPTSADLAETIEVQFTSEIMELAEDLKYNPVNISNFVRNYVDFVPTYGSIQGAQNTFFTLKGNAFDQASLLIALLRASGIHARYAYGTIELPIGDVMNWVGGFSDPYSALKLIASGGTPVTGLVSGGEIVMVRMEHVWVEAWIDYIPSRGAVHKEGDSWIAIDPSFKQYEYTNGIDFQTEVPFDSESFLSEIRSTAIINETDGSVTGVDTDLAQSRVDDYATQIDEYLGQNYPNAIGDQLVWNGEIKKKEFPFLPLSLPYTVKIKGWEAADLPSNLRHKINFTVVKDVYDEITGTPLNYSISYPEIIGKRITLSYSPATEADRSVIRSLIPDANADGTPLQIDELPSTFPSYLINLKPELRLDGDVIATGTPVVMGSDEEFTITLQSPFKNERVPGKAIAGEYYAIALDIMPIGEDVLEEKIMEYYDLLDHAETGIAYPTRDEFFGELLHTIATGYFDQYDTIEQRLSKTVGVVAHRLPSFGIVQSSLNINYFFDTPYTTNPEGLFLDIRYTETMAVSLDGNSENAINFHFNAGVMGSALEHSVPEQLFSSQATPVEGVSTVKILSMANSQNIPIYTITSANISTALPNLQTGINDEIQNAVNAGLEVITPKSNITINDWTGTGYIIFDPLTGSGGYLINGGKNGGYLSAIGSYLIACGSVIYDDDPLHGMEVMMAGINLIKEAATLWLDVLKIAGTAAVTIAMNFIPWGRVLGGVSMGLRAVFPRVTSRVVTNKIGGIAFQDVVLKALGIYPPNRASAKVIINGIPKRVIPDQIIGEIANPKVIIEIKRWKRLYPSSGNMMKNIQLAKDTGAPLRLIIKKDYTEIAPSLFEKLKEISYSIHRYDTITGELIPPLP